jgi:hypothetical protein
VLFVTGSDVDAINVVEEKVGNVKSEKVSIEILYTNVGASSVCQVLSNVPYYFYT